MNENLCFLGRRTFLIMGAVIMTISLITLSAVTEPWYPSLNSEPLPLNTTHYNSSSVTHPPRNAEALSNPLKYTCLSALMFFVVGYAVGYGPSKLFVFVLFFLVVCGFFAEGLVWTLTCWFDMFVFNPSHSLLLRQLNLVQSGKVSSAYDNYF